MTTSHDNGYDDYIDLSPDPSDLPDLNPDTFGRFEPPGWIAAVIIAVLATGGMVVGWEALRAMGLF
jgi:hypothetical protein